MTKETHSDAEIVPALLSARPTNTTDGSTNLTEGELHADEMGKQANQLTSSQYEAGPSGAICSNTQASEPQSSRAAGIHTPMPAVKRQLIEHDRDGTPNSSGLRQTVRYGFTEEASDDDTPHPRESGAKRSAERHEDRNADRQIASPQTPAIQRPDTKRPRKSATPRQAPAE